MTVYLDPRFLKHTFDLEKKAILEKAELVDEYSDFHETKKENYLKIEKNCAEIRNIIDNLPCTIIETDNQLSTILSDENKNESFDLRLTSHLKRLVRKEINDFKKRGQESFDDYNAIYFLDKGDRAIKKLRNSGVLCKDNNFNGLNLFENYNIHVDPFQFDQVSTFKNNFPNTNSMIIHDQYIFGRPHYDKLQNLLAFLQTHKCDKLEIPFHLTIFYARVKRRGERNEYVFNTDDYELIIDSLCNIKNLQFELVEMTRPKSNDRFIITNYCYITCGHPFCDTPQPTYFTQKIDLLKNNLRAKKVAEYKQLLNETNHKLIFKSKSNFQNRIFEGIT
jgi:hypothetical protein